MKKKKKRPIYPAVDFSGMDDESTATMLEELAKAEQNSTHVKEQKRKR